MESTSFTLSVKQEAAPRPKRKAKKRAVWPHLLMQAFLAAVLLYLGIMIAQSARIHTTGAGNVVLAAAAWCSQAGSSTISELMNERRTQHGKDV